MTRSFSIHTLQISVLMICMMAAPFASSETITFEEVPWSNSNCCYLTTEYETIGVTFLTTDDGSIWAGLSNGNPGTWGLEGTNGPAFLGFNGQSFSATLQFDTLIEEFKLDMGASIGWSSPDDLFILEGWRDGVLVDRVAGPALGFNQWMTVELVGQIDEVYMVAEGPSFPNSYGVDNLQWQVVDSGQGGEGEDPEDPEDPAARIIDIDVKPRHAKNVINPFARGTTRVVVFGSETLDVEVVDEESLKMGPALGTSKRTASREDVNRDGLADLVLSFSTAELGLALGDEEICLEGATIDGEALEGCDSVHTLPLVIDRAL